MNNDPVGLTRQDIQQRLKEHQDVLKKYTVRKIGVFGSYARGEQKADSDLDFLVTFEQPTFDNFMELAFYLEELFGREVDLITEGSLSPFIKPYVEREVQWYEI